MKTKVHTLIMQFIFLLYAGNIFAQVQTPLDIALRAMQTDYQKYELNTQDIADVAVSDNVFTKSNEMTSIYFVQRYEGIEIYNAIMNFTISKEGKVIFTGNRFIKDIVHKVNAAKPVVTPEEAIMNIVADLGGNMVVKPRLLETKSDKSFVFEKGLISNSNISVKLRYQPLKDGTLRLAWDVAIDYVAGTDYWSMRVDALTGKIIDKKSFTVHCQVKKDAFSHQENLHPAIEFPELLTVPQALAKTNIIGAPNQYNVFAFPLENAAQGPRTMVLDPANPIASPFGWHDTNGVTGAEFTITRGNNVHSFEDKDANYASLNDEPEGTASLNFDFPINLIKEPETNTDAAVVQLFYVINYMHDFTYKFGFDEYANFQDKNYTNTGLGADHVIALSQFDYGTLININNADFSTPADGDNGRVRMFLWDQSLSAGKLVHVNAPNTVAGAYGSTTANYGGDITFGTPITGDAIVANDGSKENPSFACSSLANGNGGQMAGKIVLIDRGGCEFGAKSLNAQNNGAIGVIICNFDETTVGMAGGVVGAQVNIPTVMLKKSDCAKIKIAAGNGLNITFQAPDPAGNGPVLIDGSLDNGIIAHEFGHGVSTRLTGG
ncbi:MAG TPA: M36 family metallopeptidase, partial [Saprospiraceae bacterium]|nr:M36 family metallopeptidase [Saprospiraceae bacterium]